ncbi:MAG: hypothetical protein COA79_03020 [Planctomycetota bacterium]|nr:MAG: hypothetical protein COA79_03020 [Planctomycetota bacterium]
MNKIIQKICLNAESNAHLEILKNIDKPTHSIKVLIKLYEINIQQSSSDTILEEISNCSPNDLPQELHILFLCQWAEISMRLNRWEEVKILSQQANDLITYNCPAEVRSKAQLLQITIYSAEKKTELREALFETAFNSLDKDSSYYAEMMASFIYFHAIDGRFYAIPEKIKFLENHPIQKYQDMIKVCHLFNDAIRGDVTRAETFIQEVDQLISDGFFPSYMDSYKRCRYLIDLMLIQQEKPSTGYLKKNLDVDRKNDPYGNHLWVQSVLYLIENQKENALISARSYFEKLDINQRFKGDEFCLIRAELANRNANAALRLLSHRLTKGLDDHLDLFFHGRAELLLNNRQKAKSYFINFINNYKKISSDGRFHFELDLSLEITRQEVYMLGQLNNEKRNVLEIIKINPTGNDKHSSLNKIISISPIITQLKEDVLKFSGVDASVLIMGETGTGKELFAKAIHSCGNRKNKPFVSINCAAISTTLVESELFGHVKGAFSGAHQKKYGLFEEAGSGTIFLDEIGELSLDLQASLLRVLESGEIRPVGSTKNKKVTCRIIAATNANLYEMVQNKQFRKDLIYRLEQLEIKIPPLSQRKEDIPLLARSFFNEGRNISEPVFLSDEFEEAIQNKDWPGNIRQLKNFVERLRVLNSEKDTYHYEDLQEINDRQKAPPKTNEIPDNKKIPSQIELSDEGIEKYLAQSSGKEKKLEKIRALFRKHKILKGFQAGHILSLPTHTISRYMNELCEEKFIKKVNKTKSPRTQYFEIIEQKSSGKYTYIVN